MYFIFKIRNLNILKGDFSFYGYTFSILMLLIPTPPPKKKRKQTALQLLVIAV